MSAEPSDGEAVETPEFELPDAISPDALLLLLSALERKFAHIATHVPERDYRTVMAELRDAAAGLSVVYKLAEALLPENNATNN